VDLVLVNLVSKKRESKNKCPIFWSLIKFYHQHLASRPRQWGWVRTTQYERQVGYLNREFSYVHCSRANLSDE